MNSDTPTPPRTLDPEVPPPLDPAFVALLACPACPDRPPLRVSPGGDALTCERCGRVFPILDGNIPDLVVDEG